MKPSGQLRSAAAALLLPLLAGCATEPVSLAVRSAPPALAELVATPVAFVHDKELVEATPLLHNQVPLRIGQASDQALRAAYARCLAQAREVPSVQAVASLPAAERPAVVLRPELAGFQTLNASGRVEGPYYAEVIYGFTLADAAGARLGEWFVHGFGEFDAQKERGERRADLRAEDWPVEASRRAVEAAMANFIDGFETVPELMRLKRRLDFTGIDAPAGQQVVADGPAPGARLGRYPGTLAVTLVPAEPPALDRAPASDVFVFRLVLRNEGTHRLLLDPTHAVLAAQDAGTLPLTPLPAPVIPVVLAGPAYGLTVGVMSPGAGMLPALLAALGNVAEHERQEAAIAAWAAQVQGELLVRGVAAAGEERSGLVYFSRLAQVTRWTLQVPVVDLDAAVRYTVTLELPPAPPAGGR